VPIYEFYCGHCHTVFSFLSRTISPTKRPACPRCGRPDLERRMSRFAISRGRTEDAKSADEPPDLDEAKMEAAMEDLAREGEGLDEEDPRQMARLMRKLHESGGLPLNEGMKEAIRRMEAGEDPDKIEEELGDLLEEEPSGAGETGSGESASRLGGLMRRLKPPEVDETLYDL